MTERDAARAILFDLARQLGHDVTAAQAEDWESSGYYLGGSLLISDLVRAWTLIISQVERVHGLPREVAEQICERLNLRALAAELDTALARAGDRFGFVAQELKRARLSVGTDAAEATLRLACAELQRADDLVRKLGKTLAELKVGTCGDVEGDPRGGQTE